MLNGQRPPVRIAQSTLLGQSSGPATFAVRNANGSAGEPFKLIEPVGLDLIVRDDLHVDPAHVTAAVARGAGRTISIDGKHVRDGFAGDPNVQPAQASFDPGYDTGTIRFYRPLDSAQDVNADDAFQTPGDDAELDVSTDGTVPLDVSASASTTNLQADAAVQLAASAPAGTTVFWDFGDGTPSGSGATVSHAFAAGGTYDVTARAVARDGSSGVSSPVRITVGTPRPGGVATTPSAATPAPTAGTGGSGSGGGRAPTGGGTGTAGPSTGARHGGRGARPAPPNRRATPSGSTTPRRPAAPASPSPGATTTPGASGSPASGSSRRPAPPTRRAPTRAAPVGRPIDGVLVAGPGDDVTRALQAAAAAARTDPAAPATARAAAGDGSGPAGPIAGGAAVLALLAAGAVGEGLRASARSRTT